jgi:hypothetical protein
MPDPRDRKNKTHRVIHPPTLTGAEHWKRWIVPHYVAKKWRQLGLDDDDQAALEIMVMMQPKGFPVVPGTGGLRKLRFATSGKGKRGSFRVGYGTICLLAVYAKNDQRDIPAAQRAEIRKLITGLHQWVAGGG